MKSDAGPRDRAVDDVVRIRDYIREWKDLDDQQYTDAVEHFTRVLCQGSLWPTSSASSWMAA